jgi:prevent-host-death family protein
VISFYSISPGICQKSLDFLAWSGQTIFKEVAKMLITNISEAKAQLSALIEKVMAGHEVIIGKAGKPVAKLVRYERSEKPRQPGALRGKIKISDDFDKLPEDIAKAFGMKD